MLITTLNHNLPDLTDNLYSQILKSKREKDEIMILDNGSKKENIAKSTTHRLEENIFFGGGVNVILDYFLNQTNQDYLMILNNDLIFHGYNFIQNVENEIISNNIDVYSPSIINASINQCHWKQMYNWGSYSVRDVRWIDFQSPVLSRRVCEKIQQYPDELIYGWGNDFYTGIVCEQNNYITAVSDLITITHLNSQTFEQNKINIGISEFCRNAEYNMNNYFSNKNKDLYLELREYGSQYNFTK